MLCYWMIAAAAVMGQTTQPAAERPAAARIRVVPPGERSARAAAVPTAAPSTTAPADRGPLPGLNSVGELTGDQLDVQATSDNNIILTGNEQDLLILQAVIEALDKLPKAQFKIFNLEYGTARELATAVQDLWTKAKTPSKAPMRAEDRLTIIPEPRSNVLMVAATEENLVEIEVIIKQLDKPSLKDSVKFTPIQLTNIKALEAEEVVKGLLDTLQKQRGLDRELFNIKAEVRTNRLLVAAPEADLEQIKHLIELIDVPPDPESGGVVKVGVYPLQKAVARELADTLNEMLQAEGDAAQAMEEEIRRLQVILKKRGGDEKALSDVNLEKPIKILAEVGSNSIIVATVESNLEPIGEIIMLLDSVPLGDEVLVKIFPLKHADAETLRTGLADMFDQGQRVAEQPGKAVAGRIGQGLPGEALGYEVGLVADKRTNTLLVSGRAEQLLLVEKVVASVDVAENPNKFPPRLVTLKHADVTRIVDVVTKLGDQRAKMAEGYGRLEQERERILAVPDQRTNSLIIIANDANFEEIKSLTNTLDGADDKWLGEIRIINVKDPLSAADIQDKIDTLWERRAEQRRLGGLPEDKPVIVSDPRSNSLVIASNTEDYEAIVKVVDQLQQQPLAQMHDVRQIILKHNDANKLADLVSQLFDERLQMSLGEGDREQPSERVFIVADPMTNMLLVASSKSNYDEVVRLVSQLDVALAVEGTLKTFYVKNTDVIKAAELLQDLFDKGIYRGAGPQEIPESLKNVTMVPDLRSSALIVSASPENLTIVESLLKEIDRIDTPNFQADAKFISIHNADVVNVADMLTQLFEGMRSALGDQADQLELTIIPNVRSNVLILSGSRYAMKRAEELVPSLDVPMDRAAYEMKVYKLKQASASRLEPLMTRLFEERATGEQAGERTPIIILPDDGSNSLIVSASRDDHLEVEGLLEKLDRNSTLTEQMEIIPLEKAKAETIADTLTEMIEAQSSDDAQGGFAVTAEPRTNSLIVFAAPDMMTSIREIIKKLDNSRPKEERALRVFRLNNAQAEDLSQLLDEFFQAAGAGEGDDMRQLIIKFTPVNPDTRLPVMDAATGEKLFRTLVHQDITIKPDAYTNSLMVMAPADQMDMMEMLIEMLDSNEPRTAEVRAFELRNADAEEMQQLLEDLFDSGQGQEGEGRTLIIGTGAGAAPAGGAGAAGGETEVAFSVDRRTNTLIAAGTPAQLRIIETLVYRLDDQDIEERVVRVVPLQYAEAEDVAGTLTDYFDKETGFLEEAEGEAAAVRQLRRQVTIQDGGESSNTLLLSYSPQMESQLVNMINELDRPPPQVMIQVLMAEVTLNDSFELGMEFALQDLLFSEKAFLGPNGTVQGDGKDVIFGTDVGATGSGGLGGVSFTVTGEDFSFLARALQTEGRLEILSRPAILVQDNQEANITVGERVPTVQDIVVSSNGVITPSVNYEEVGIILDVTPIINPDGYVNLEIAPEISAIGTSTVTVATGVTLPTFTQRSADTSVTVKDGETIIIGGLITSRVSQSENKVPLLGDVPILGNLMKASQRSESKTELMIVLTPHVVRTSEDAHTMSIQLRDSTGLMDETRMSPLMQGLRVDPNEDQLGPVDDLLPRGEQRPSGLEPPPAEEMGPVLEEFGPPTTSIEYGPDREALAVRQ